MPHPELHVIGVDPGKATGIARLTVPRAAFYPEEGVEAEHQILSWEVRELHGRESDQVMKICEICRTAQSLAYKVGPALVVEDFDFGSPIRDREAYSPVRIGAMLTLCRERTALMNDAKLVFMPRSLPKEAYPDARLRQAGFWVSGPDHKRDAIRIALTALRRARQSRSYRDTLWGG